MIRRGNSAQNPAIPHFEPVAEYKQQQTEQTANKRVLSKLSNPMTVQRQLSTIIFTERIEKEEEGKD